MPTYVYACTDAECGHQFEAVQTFTDNALTECPICAHRLRKVYGSVGVVFKGSGFYRNDSRPKPAEPGSTGKDKTSDTAGKEAAGAAAASSSGGDSSSNGSSSNGSSKGSASNGSASNGSSSNGSSSSSKGSAPKGSSSASNGSSSASSAKPVASTG